MVSLFVAQVCSKFPPLWFVVHSNPFRSVAWVSCFGAHPFVPVRAFDARCGSSITLLRTDNLLPFHPRSFSWIKVQLIRFSVFFTARDHTIRISLGVRIRTYAGFADVVGW